MFVIPRERSDRGDPASLKNWMTTGRVATKKLYNSYEEFAGDIFHDTGLLTPEELFQKNQTKIV